MADDSPEARLRELGLTLPPQGGPAGSYVTAVTVNGFVYLSGHGPFHDGTPTCLGRVPSQVDVATANAAARLTALNLLGTLRDHLGSLDRVQRLVRIGGFVNADDDFVDHVRVIDGASALLLSVFGPERGSHVRAAVGVGSLPFGLSVEIDLVAVI